MEWAEVGSNGVRIAPINFLPFLVATLCMCADWCPAPVGGGRGGNMNMPQQ